MTFFLSDICFLRSHIETTIFIQLSPQELSTKDDQAVSGVFIVTSLPFFSHIKTLDLSQFTAMTTNKSRQYNTSNNQSAVRNSTNPFIDEPSSPVDPVSKPMRPSTSTKPTIRSVRVKQSSRGAEKEQREEERREQRDEKRDERREERRRERSDRPDRPHRSEKSSSKDEKHRSSGKGDKKKGVPLDIIDKLDVTGLFGPGSFHHDGPFDACNPHRNKNTKEAPVLAFPADGANNSLTAVDPNEKYATENKVFGRSNVDEVYDYRGPVTAIARPFDSSMKQLPVHGDTTLGLGSSTFLDGTPASREAIVKSGEEASQGAMLGRKKSLVAKLRGSNGPGPAVPPKSRIVPHLPLSATSGPIIRTNSHPVQSPSMKDSFDESIRSISSGDKESSGGGGSGLLRRVKSLKVGSRRKGS